MMKILSTVPVESMNTFFSFFKTAVEAGPVGLKCSFCAQNVWTTFLNNAPKIWLQSDYFCTPCNPQGKSLKQTVQNLLKKFSYPVLQAMFRNV